MNPGAFLASTLGKLIMLLILFGVIFIAVHSCSSSRDKAATARQQGAEAEAVADGAQEAVNTVVARHGADADVDAIVDEAAARLDPALPAAERHEAVLEAVCQMKINRRKPECAFTPPQP